VIGHNLMTATGDTAPGVPKSEPWRNHTSISKSIWRPLLLLKRSHFPLIAAVALVSWLSAMGVARADLRLCNKTTSQIGVAIGYKDDKQWITEGWWNLPAESCETLVSGPLISRFYYVYAIDYQQGGEWGGKAFMCTRDKEFTIRGIEDCITRGFEKTGFFEIDTGEQRSWTVQLTEPSQQGTGGR